ncbi:hypothetical protein BGZ98_006637 [Dissophora globulifera]|nr:hypothetical protein BGZ98_006637 [Dissophora globulifera]
MFIKSAAVAALALVASVSAQTPNHTYFTNPVGDGMVYTVGDNATFSWQTACVAPSTFTSATPTKVPVQLLNATNSDLAFFLADVGTIDCTQSQGNQQWTIPGNFGTSGLFSLKLVFDNNNVAYSGRFSIKSNSPAPPAQTTGASAPGKSAANVVAPLLSGAAAAVAGALLFL